LTQARGLLYPLSIIRSLFVVTISPSNDSSSISLSYGNSTNITNIL
jgi:hypothetical protein